MSRNLRRDWKQLKETEREKTLDNWEKLDSVEQQKKKVKEIAFILIQAFMWQQDTQAMSSSILLLMSRSMLFFLYLAASKLPFSSHYEDTKP